jgi:signal transduction histidine kinase
MQKNPDRSDAEHRAADAQEQGDTTDVVELERRVGQFLRELAHELGNLAFPLQMILDLQSRSRPLSPEELHTALHGHMLELLALTRRFQRIGRCISGCIEPQFDAARVADIVHGAVHECRHALDERRHTLHQELSEAVTTVRADPELLQQALSELLDNAARFSSAGGRIDVVVERRGRSVEFLVRDSGPGFPPELRPHVFGLFAHGGPKLDFSAGRLGCGLTLVQRIAAAHGGSAGIRRSEADGSELVVCVPAE